MSKKKKNGGRVVFEDVYPEIDGGAFPIKRIKGEKVDVSANVFADGHDNISAFLLYKVAGDKEWTEVLMETLHNDRWKGSFLIEKEADYVYSVRGYVNEFSSWQEALQKRVDAECDVSIDLQIGVQLIEAIAKTSKAAAESLNDYIKKVGDEKDQDAAIKAALEEDLCALMTANLDKEKSTVYEKELKVSIERAKALYSSWYELFPRSWSNVPGEHGTFKDCEKLLPKIAELGFDVVYFPPIHPIGKTHRKGINNSTECTPEDVGCPWAIGSDEGGHKDILSELGTIDDLKNFMKEARKSNIELAIDIAFQCSMDHPYIKEHPSWFKWRPDGTIQFAENPPKKYEDIVPINFETDDWKGLWDELKSVVMFWAEAGVRIFRVDNPHTKPFAFWDWLISEVKKDYPDAIFLSEAFTRPHIMYRLAKGGFSQSYTYFTWRNGKQEFIDYMTELTKSEVSEYFRPNFWPNTPDILAFPMQGKGRSEFIARAVLAATLSSNFGIYGPAFELCESKPFPEKEEYDFSEKYEIKKWDWDRKGNIKPTIAALNKMRKENKCFQQTRNIEFLDVNNENILCFYKYSDDLTNTAIVVISLDQSQKQAGTINIPLDKFGIKADSSYVAEDLLTGAKFKWKGDSNYIDLDPKNTVAHVIKIKR